MIHKVLVCGGRKFANLYYYNAKAKKYEKKYGELYMKAQREIDFVIDTLDYEIPLIDSDSNIKIISGGAKGPDNIAITWAMTNHIPYAIYNANWAKHGNAAGPIRNQLMLDSELDYHIDSNGNKTLAIEHFTCIAFPGEKGTADMVRRCKKLNIPVIEVEYNDN